MATKQLKTKYLSQTGKISEEFNGDLPPTPPPPEFEKESSQALLPAPWPPPFELLSPTSTISPSPQGRDVSPTPSDMSMVCHRSSPPIKDEIPSPTPSVTALGDSDTELPEEPPYKRRCSSPQNYHPQGLHIPTSNGNQPFGLLHGPLHGPMISVPSHPIFPVVAVIAVPGYNPHAPHMVPPLTQHPHMMPSLPQHPASIQHIRPMTQLDTRMHQQVGINSNASIPHGVGISYNSRMPQHSQTMPQKSGIPSNIKIPLGMPTNPRMSPRIGIPSNTRIPHGVGIQPDRRIPPGKPSNLPPLQPIPIRLKDSTQQRLHHPVIIHPPLTTSLGYPVRPMHTLDERERNEKYSLSKIHPIENPLPPLELTAAKYVCTTCHRVFPSLGSREEHMKDMHQQEAPVVNSDKDKHDPDDPDKISNISSDAHNGEERLGKDEKKAKKMGIDSHISVWDIVMLPMDEFNERLATSEMTDEQINECRDIRRRGKNKVAAQNCRKRKNTEIEDLSKKKTELSGYLSRRSKALNELNQNLIQWENLFSELEVDILDQQELNKRVFKIIEEQGKIKFAKREPCEIDLVSGKCHGDANLILDTTDASAQTVIRRQQNSTTLDKRRRPIEGLSKKYRIPAQASLTKVSNPLQINQANTFHPPSNGGLSFVTECSKSKEVSSVTWTGRLKPAPTASVIRLSRTVSDAAGYSQPSKHFDECLQERQDLPIPTTNVPTRRAVPPGVSTIQITELEKEMGIQQSLLNKNSSMDTHVSKYSNRVPNGTRDLRTFRRQNIREPIIVSKTNVSNFPEDKYPQSHAAKYPSRLDLKSSSFDTTLKPDKGSGLSPGINSMNIQSSGLQAMLPCTAQGSNLEFSKLKDQQGSDQSTRAFIQPRNNGNTGGIDTYSSVVKSTIAPTSWNISQKQMELPCTATSEKI